MYAQAETNPVVVRCGPCVLSFLSMHVQTLICLECRVLQGILLHRSLISGQVCMMLVANTSSVCVFEKSVGQL